MTLVMLGGGPGLQNYPLEPPPIIFVVLLAPLGAFLGPLWRHLGLSWGHLGLSSGHLEAILAYLGANLR